MALDAFTPRTMLEMVQVMREPMAFFTKMFFSNTEDSPTEYIDIDKDDEGLTIANFVEPGATAAATETQGYEVHSFRLPTMRELNEVGAKHLQQRMPGENIYGGSSVAERDTNLAARSVATMMGRINRRVEVMAAQIAYNGEIPILDQYGRVLRANIKFPRAPETMPVLTGDEAWNSGSSDLDILGKIEDFSGVAEEKAGVTPDIYWGSADVWKRIKKDPGVIEAMDTRNADFGKLQSEAIGLGVRLAGLLNGIPFYVVRSRYRVVTLDGNGNPTYIWLNAVPSGTFGMGSTQGNHRIIEGPVYQFDEKGKAITASGIYPHSEMKSKNPPVRTNQIDACLMPFTGSWDSFVTATVLDPALEVESGSS